MPKNLRGKQLDSLIHEAETGERTGIRAQPEKPAAKPTMSQAEFSGYDKPRSTKPPAEVLKRFDRTPYNYDKSGTDKKAGRYK